MATQYLAEVVGTKMNKTVKVLVRSMKLHPVVLKYWNYKEFYLAHDDKNECKIGDMVIIKKVQKISPRKSFTITEVVDKIEDNGLQNSTNI